MKRRSFAIPAFALALCLISPMNVYAGESQYYTGDEYHADLDYEDMDIVWVDEDATRAYLDTFEKTIESGDADAVIAGYDKLNALIDYIDTMYELNEIRYNLNTYNDEYADLSISMSEFSTEITDRSLSLMRDALDSSCGEALKEHIGDEDLVDALLEYEEMTDEQKKLKQEYEKLTQEYDRLVSADVHIQVDGEDWSFEKLQSDTTLDYYGYLDVAGKLCEAYNRELSLIYIDIVRILNRQAQIREYDNFAEYSYEMVYNRDYDQEDIETVYKAVQDYIVPLHEELSENIAYNYKLENMKLSEDEKIERVGKVIGKVHPDLLIAWDYLTEHHLYDIDPSQGKLDSGYTVPLFTYGSGFIFDSPYENWRDLQTVIHEFGHFNETFHSNSHRLTYIHNTDVAEIHSQGLELLCLEYADEVYGAGCGEIVSAKVIDAMLDGIIDGCIYDEFQWRVYTYDGELTTDKLNEMFREISAQYGYDPESVNYLMWVGIPHTFTSPMYYISYATSALAALDIYALSVEDRDAAIDCYMNLTNYHGEQAFRETLEDVGLPDIFEEGTIEDISIAVRDTLKLSPVRGLKRLLKDPVLIISVMIMLVVFAAVIIVRIRAKKRLKQAQNIAFGPY